MMPSRIRACIQLVVRSRMNLQDSRVLINENTELQEVSNAAEPPQKAHKNLTSSFIIITTASARRLLAIASHGTLMPGFAVEQSVLCELAPAGAIEPAGFASHKHKTAGFFEFLGNATHRTTMGMVFRCCFFHHCPHHERISVNTSFAWCRESNAISACPNWQWGSTA
jgi:hypothetical protein